MNIDIPLPGNRFFSEGKDRHIRERPKFGCKSEQRGTGFQSLANNAVPPAKVRLQFISPLRCPGIGYLGRLRVPNPGMNMDCSSYR